MVLMRAYATAVVAPLSLSEFEELHEIRMALEPLLSQMALPTLPRHHLLKMRELNELMQGSDDGETWLNANDEFHALLYRETDRPWMVEIVDRARRLTSRYTSILVVKMGSRQGELEHVGIMEAIEGQDTRELGRRLSAHMESGYDLVIKHLARHPELLGSQPDGCGGKTR